jgi:hypothetical protein
VRRFDLLSAAEGGRDRPITLNPSFCADGAVGAFEEL